MNGSKPIINYFEERSNPHVGLFFDSSKTLKGRQSIQNILMFLRSVTYPWNNPSENLSDDRLRVILKRTFFPYYKDINYTYGVLILKQSKSVDSLIHSY